jgi:hypothetical protein
MAQAIHQQRQERTGAPEMTPEEQEQRRLADERAQTGQVLLEAGLLEQYQQQCAGAMTPAELRELVHQISTGQIGHDHAADSAQQWLLEHSDDEHQGDESEPDRDSDDEHSDADQTGPAAQTSEQVACDDEHRTGDDDEHSDADQTGTARDERAEVIRLTERMRQRSHGHAWRS